MDLTFRILGFGPFEDSGEFTVSPGLNVFTGLNNVGKTALLYALFALRNGPTGPNQGGWAGLERERQRIEGYRRGRPSQWAVLTLDPGEQVRAGIWGRIQGPKPRAFASLTLACAWRGNGAVIRGIGATSVDGERYTVLGEPPAAGYAPVPAGPGHRADRAEELARVLGLSMGPGPAIIAASEAARAAIGWPGALTGARFIAAQREVPPPPAAAAMREPRPLPDASDLPAVLFTLHNSTAANADLLARIVGELRAFFPEVESVRISVSPHSEPGGNTVTLVAEGGAAGVPLDRCGTGVWQTLVLLTAALVENEARLFLIDEPHSFLHPAAERKLVRLLESLGHEKGHIFCVATHSHIIANHAGARLWGVFSENGTSAVRELSGYRDAAAAIGIEAADVLAHDAILTVEGPSDQYVLRALLDETGASRIAVTRLRGDGQVRKSDGCEQLRRIAKELVAAVAPVHVPVTLLLDRDGWSESDITELKNEGGARFLKQPEIENYFLHPEAIARAFALSGDQAEAVKQSIAGATAGAKGSGVISKALWDGAQISYRKAQDLPKIFEALRCVDDAALEPLRAEVKAVAEFLLGRGGQ